MELLERIVSNRNVRRAYEQVMRNKGAGGVDGIEIDGFKSHLQSVWPAVKASILSGNYQPAGVRKVAIRKEGGGERILGIPTLLDRLIQQGRTELDTKKRAQVYEQIAAIVTKERPIVYLYHRNWLWAHSAKLAGLRAVPDGLVRVQGLRVN